MGYPHNEYASKGVAGTGLGLGIAGTALALLNNKCGNSSILGNLLGGNCNNNNLAAVTAENQYVSSLQAENAMLKSQNYADKNSKEVYQQTLADNKALRDELFSFIKPLAEESANNRVTIATLQAEQKCCCEKQELREQILIGKINEVALTTKGRFDNLDNTISCLAGQVNSNTTRLNNITKSVIPTDVICPDVMPRYNSWVAPTTTPTTSA